MIEPSYVPRDINGYEEKIMFGLSSRQLFWGCIAIGVGFSFYFVTYSVFHIWQDICMFGTIVISFGLFVLGWAKWQGTRPFSEYLKVLWKFKSTKQNVIYSNEIYYFERKGGVRRAKTRTDKKINKKECREWREKKKKNFFV